MAEGRHKEPKQGLKPHTGMIEFKYSKVYEDYMKIKTGKLDNEIMHKLNPKRDAVCVVLYNIHDENTKEIKDVSVESYILRGGNFGTPQVPPNFFATFRQDTSMMGSLPPIDESQPTLVSRSFTEISLRDSALGISRVESSRQSLDKISLPSIKTSAKGSIKLSKRKLLGSTSLKADRAKLLHVPKPPPPKQRRDGKLSSGV